MTLLVTWASADALASSCDRPPQGLTCTLFLAYHGPIGGGTGAWRGRSRPPVVLEEKAMAQVCDASHATLRLCSLVHAVPECDGPAMQPAKATGEEVTWWVETLSTEPRIFRIHELLTPTECEHCGFPLPPSRPPVRIPRR